MSTISTAIDELFHHVSFVCSYTDIKESNVLIIRAEKIYDRSLEASLETLQVYVLWRIVTLIGLYGRRRNQPGDETPALADFGDICL